MIWFVPTQIICLNPHVASLVESATLKVQRIASKTQDGLLGYWVTFFSPQHFCTEEIQSCAAAVMLCTFCVTFPSHLPWFLICTLKCMTYFCQPKAHMSVAAEVHFVRFQNSLSSPMQFRMPGTPGREQSPALVGFLCHRYQEWISVHSVPHKTHQS